MSPHRRSRRGGVSSLEDRHNEQVAVFFGKAWGQQSSAADVAEWRERDARTNPVTPGAEPPKWVFVKGDEVIGYLSSIPTRFVVDETERIGHWLKGFWVLEEYRGGPVGFAILQRAMTDLGVAASTLVAEPARRLMEAEGMTDLGLFFNRLKVLRCGRLLRKLDVERLDLEGLSGTVARGVRVLQVTRTAGLAGACVSAATWAASTIRGTPPRGLRVTRGWDSVSDRDLDEAWSGFAGTVRAGSVRDASLVRWRYDVGDYYDLVGVWTGQTLRAWAIVRKPSVDKDGRLKGISVASLSDVLFPADQPGLGLAAVAAAEDVARGMGADALLCSGTHGALDAALGRRGFVPLPGNLHILLRDPDTDPTEVPLTEWWLTRGDGRADESF